MKTRRQRQMSMWMSLRMSLCWVVFCGLVWACGSGKRQNDDTRAAADDAGVNTPVAPLPLLPMGMSDLRDYAYSMGPGRDAFIRAREADKRRDTSAVVEHARAAVAADARHLEAHWYLALALARERAYDQVAGHLAVAVAGDWMRWGERSMSIKALSGFYETPHGVAYHDAVARYRERFRTMVAQGLLVVGRRGQPWGPKDPGDGSINHRSEIYAYDLGAARYVRLSRTNGSLVGFVPAPERTALAFVSYRAVWTLTPPPTTGSTTGSTTDAATGAATTEPYIRKLEIGTIDLNDVSMSAHEIPLDGVAELWLGYQPGAATDRAPNPAPRLSALVRSPAEPGQPPTLRLYQLDTIHGHARLLTANAVNPAETGSDDALALPGHALSGDVLHVAYDRVERLRIPIPGVMADWDEAGAAGAFRLEHTRKTVTLAGGALAYGHAMSWSHSRAWLAFTDLPDHPCEPQPKPAAAVATTLYVVEAATGTLRQVATIRGLQAPEWAGDEHLAFTVPNGPHNGRHNGPHNDVVQVIDAATGEHVTTLETQGGVGTSHLAARPFPARGCANEP